MPHECRALKPKASFGLKQPRRHHVADFDPHARAIFGAAQKEAEARGGSFVLSGFILLAAASGQDAGAIALLRSMNADLATLMNAVEVEWSSRSQYLQDAPPTLVNESINAVAGAIEPGSTASVTALLVAMLAYEDSMASRIVARLGVTPKQLASKLTNTT
jgi:ATP-dependent Clp protease ATP-binding subunit ClpA